MIGTVETCVIVRDSEGVKEVFAWKSNVEAFLGEEFYLVKGVELPNTWKIKLINRRQLLRILLEE